MLTYVGIWEYNVLRNNKKQIISGGNENAKRV